MKEIQKHFDSEGIELKEGDKVTMILVGLGSGEMSIVLADNELNLYDEQQGLYPLKYAEKRQDMILKRIN